MPDHLDWPLEYAAGVPPLPKKLLPPGRAQLPTGAYYVRFDPVIAGDHDIPKPPQIFIGILRVRNGSDSISASGDLYSCSRKLVADIEGELDSEKDPAARLKCLQLPVDDYTYYLRLVTFREGGNFELDFESYEWDKDMGPPGRGTGRPGWKTRWPLTLQLPREGLPRHGFEKESRISFATKCYPVLNSSETVVAEMGVTWISEIVRHSNVEIHDVDTEVVTVDTNRQTVDPELWDHEAWRRALGVAGWSFELGPLLLGPPKPNILDRFKKGRWTRRRLNRYHDNYLEKQRRPKMVDGRNPWTYYFLVVDNIEIGDTGRPSGLMYDVGSLNPKDLPRQGAAIAAKRKHTWREKSAGESKYGQKREIELYREPALFNRTALHELGHMQGLFHNNKKNSRGLMSPHSELEDRGFEPRKDSIHSDDDAFRLWHFPDLRVRPGGMAFDYRYRETAVDIRKLVPETPDMTLAVEVEPYSVAAGSFPAALALTLTNVSRKSILCPNALHAQPRYHRLGVLLRTPSGHLNEVWPIRYPREFQGMGGTPLLKGDKLRFKVPWNESMPLDQAGVYELQVHLTWIGKSSTSSEKIFYRVSSGPQALRAI